MLGSNVNVQTIYKSSELKKSEIIIGNQCLTTLFHIVVHFRYTNRTICSKSADCILQK